MLDMVTPALRARASGLSILPIMPGSKRPAWDVLPLVPDPQSQELEHKWEPFQTRIAGEDEIQKMFARGQWLAVICGTVSQNLELMDFDIPDKAELPEGKQGVARAYKPFLELVKYHEREELIRRLVIVRTKSGGIHLLYKCQAQPEGNQKLASTLYKNRPAALIETRGEGGYFVTSPTPGYEVLSGSLEAIPTITEEEREFLLRAARSLNEIDEPDEDRPEKRSPIAGRPGDDFNARATWDDILAPHGWTAAGKTAGNRRTWVRPGKQRKDGISATTGTGPDLMVVFSVNAAPLEARAYTKFQVYTLLEHHGDWMFAAQVLRSQGYGGPKPKTHSAQIIELPHAKQPAPGELDDLEEFGDDFEPVTMEFYWNPYLPKGKNVLLDADGGVGKTSLALGCSAMFSNGITPISGEVCDPLRTLYLHRGEDQSDELETVYRANGGKQGMIRYYRKHDLFFNAEGLERVHGWITAGKFSIVIVDALFYFLPTDFESTNDNLLAQRVIQGLNEVADDTKATFWNQRHTTKGTVAKAAEHLGMGSVAFRNSHRGQLVARFHPTQRGVIIVEDKKASLMVERGEHFAYRRNGLGIEFIHNMKNPFDETRPEPQNKVENAGEFIREYCQDWVYVTALDAEAARRGISVRGALERAKRDLNDRNILEYRKTATGGLQMVRFCGGPNDYV